MEKIDELRVTIKKIKSYNHCFCCGNEITKEEIAHESYSSCDNCDSYGNKLKYCFACWNECDICGYNSCLGCGLVQKCENCLIHLCNECDEFTEGWCIDCCYKYAFDEDIILPHLDITTEETPLLV